MELFFSPLACSMSARIALAEAAAEVTLIEVDPHTNAPSIRSATCRRCGSTTGRC
jgi:glutathione S-transferase